MNTDNKNTETKQCTTPSVSSSFYSLIDRLQVHSEWKYPNRKWDNYAYYGIAFEWIGKDKDLEERVLKLEAEMKLSST